MEGSKGHNQEPGKSIQTPQRPSVHKRIGDEWYLSLPLRTQSPLARRTPPSKGRASLLPPCGDIKGIKHCQIVKQACHQQERLAVLVGDPLSVFSKSAVLQPTH